MIAPQININNENWSEQSACMYNVIALKCGDWYTINPYQQCFFTLFINIYHDWRGGGARELKQTTSSRWTCIYVGFTVDISMTRLNPHMKNPVFSNVIMHNNVMF